jgi:hypothetical protein
MVFDDTEVSDMADAVDSTDGSTTGTGPTDPTQEFLGLLAEHVPLALLADLAAPSVPGSTAILRAEGLPDDAWWETTDPGVAARPTDPEPPTA